MCRVDICRSSIFKKDQENQSEKFDFPLHQIKKCKKRQDSFRVCNSTSTAMHILKVVLVTKGKLKSDVNIIWDLIRDEKYVDDNIHVFHLLWGLKWKILIGKYCEDSAWAECLKLYDKKKKFKMVLLGKSENNCHAYWFGSMWEIFKMESFKLYIP